MFSKMSTPNRLLELKREASPMNDSGFSSPSKCLEGDDEPLVHFTINWPSIGKQEVVAEASKFLAQVLTDKFKAPANKISSLLFYAETVGKHKSTCINPFLISCGSIRPSSEIFVQACGGIKYGEQKLEIGGKNVETKRNVEATLFFISILDRKHKRRITHVQLDKFRCDEICVVAFSGQSCKHALLQDGRFKDVCNFILCRKEGESGDIGDYQPVRHFKNECLVLCVKWKDSQSIVIDVQNSLKSSTSADAGASTSEADEVFKTPKKEAKLNKNKLSDRLWEEKAVYVFPEEKQITDLTNKEMIYEMGRCLIAEAWSTLVGPGNRAGEKYKKAICSLGKTQFANHHILSRPVSFTKQITPLFDSICYIECGDITATGFLVSVDMIVTNCHVVNQIEIARTSSNRVNYQIVFVCFDYEEHGATLKTEYQLKLPFVREGNIFSEGLDYAFLRLNKIVNSRAITLGQYVSSIVPGTGKVAIVGHPSGREKQEEMCAILPLHEGRRSLELQRRVQEQEQQHCNQSPFNCVERLNRDTKCIHSYREKIEKLPGNQTALTYDVGSMFEGSSGAPVFDMRCNVVALHTLGFRVGQSSIMEVGITFEAIIRDLESKGYSDFVERTFPRHKSQPMDEDT